MTAEDCDRLRLLIQAEVDAAETAALLTHLDTCPGCAQLREEVGQLSA